MVYLLSNSVKSNETAAIKIRTKWNANFYRQNFNTYALFSLSPQKVIISRKLPLYLFIDSSFNSIPLKRVRQFNDIKKRRAMSHPNNSEEKILRKTKKDKVCVVKAKLQQRPLTSLSVIVERMRAPVRHISYGIRHCAVCTALCRMYGTITMLVPLY